MAFRPLMALAAVALSTCAALAPAQQAPTPEQARAAWATVNTFLGTPAAPVSPVVAPVPTPTPSPTPAPVTVARTGQPVRSMPKMTIPEIRVGNGGQVVHVPLEFDAPLPMSITYLYTTRNASSLPGADGKAWEGGTYQRNSGAIIVPMGAKRFTIPVRLYDMKPGWRVEIEVGWNEDYPQANGASQMIVGDPGRVTSQPAEPATAAVQPRTPGKLVFETDFVKDFRFTKEGGNGAFAEGYEKDRYINQELGSYAGVDDGGNPFPLIDGVRNLQVERTPGKPIIYRGAGREFRLPYLTTRNLVTQPYGIFEVAFGPIDRAQGILPAWWRLPVDGSWPPEDDLFELWSKDRFTRTSHYRDDQGQGKFGHNAAMAVAGIDPAKGFLMRVEADPLLERTFVRPTANDPWVLIDTRPNVFHVPMYHIFSIAVGGGAAGALDPKVTFPKRMAIKRMQVWDLPN